MPIIGNPIYPPVAPGLNQTAAQMVVCDAHGAPEQGVNINFRLIEALPLAGLSLSHEPFTVASGAGGVLQVLLIQGAMYEAWRRGQDPVRFTTPLYAVTYAMPAI